VEGEAWVRPSRPLVAVAAAALLAAGCSGRTTAGSGSPAAVAPSAPTPIPSPPAADNGVAALPADDVLVRARAALRTAPAVRIRGVVEERRERISLDIRYAGRDSSGVIGQRGQVFEFRRLGAVVYLKGDRRFWLANGGEAVARLLTGAWLKVPMTDKELAGFTELTDLTKAAANLLPPAGTLTTGGRKVVGGVPAVGLDANALAGGTLYVATTGRPYPLLIEAEPGSAGENRLIFSEYGKRRPVTPPPADQVIDSAALPGG
jgi:hypothetical protein